jgi:hypothetical protein
MAMDCLLLITAAKGSKDHGRNGGFAAPLAFPPAVFAKNAVAVMVPGWMMVMIYYDLIWPEPMKGSIHTPSS